MYAHCSFLYYIDILALGDREDVEYLSRLLEAVHADFRQSASAVSWITGW